MIFTRKRISKKVVREKIQSRIDWVNNTYLDPETSRRIVSNLKGLMRDLDL